MSVILCDTHERREWFLLIINYFICLHFNLGLYVMLVKLYLITWCLGHLYIQWTWENSIPACANISLSKYWEEKKTVWENKIKMDAPSCPQISFRACIFTYWWCLSPSTRKIRTGISAAANWGEISQRPSHFSAVPGLCQHLPPSALLVWRNTKNSVMYS